MPACRTASLRWHKVGLSAVFALGGAPVRPLAAAVSVPDLPLLDRYCLACHNSNTKTAGLELDSIRSQSLDENAELWEKVVHKLRHRHMPPLGLPRPAAVAYDQAVSSLEDALDRVAEADPNPGRTATFRRLNRTEYRNAIRDLLGLEVDVGLLLPADESGHGFDNVTVGDLSPTLLDRYLSTAEKISRLAVGRQGSRTSGYTVRVRPDLTQEKHFEELPLGTRGGVAVHHNFPVDGNYEIRVRLARDRNEHVEGLSEPHELELLLDRGRVARFTVQPPTQTEAEAANPYRPSHQNLDQNLRARIPVKAGAHTLGVTFLKKPSLLEETELQPYQAHFNIYRHPRIQPAIYSVSILGPYESGAAGDTPGRRRLFECRPTDPEGEESCARATLSKLMRRAYRRPVTDDDLRRSLELYRQERERNGFDAGVEMALSAVLVSPEFLFRIEHEPADLPPGTPYPISDLELASRLSFFLWSSIPDEELLETAFRGDLRRPEVLERQALRMLADPRSRSLVENFASQWLHLRNLASTTPDMRLFPDFDDNLRQALRQETELFFESILREDRSVLDLLRADYTFLNERLASHYGIPHVYGSRFRRVELDGESRRGGLLRQGSILTVTSYATRTSPVIRGKWILENLLGVRPSPPPPGVPELEEQPRGGRALSMRERMAEHRSNPACTRCHDVMDPLGLALENYDPIGRWRRILKGQSMDVTGQLPDGTRFDGVTQLQGALLARPELLVHTLVEKLLTYALGRGVEHYDFPAVRRVVRQASERDYRFSELILGVVRSTPFQMRRSS